MGVTHIKPVDMNDTVCNYVLDPTVIETIVEAVEGNKRLLRENETNVRQNIALRSTKNLPAKGRK